MFWIKKTICWSISLLIKFVTLKSIKLVFMSRKIKIINISLLDVTLHDPNLILLKNSGNHAHGIPVVMNSSLGIIGDIFFQRLARCEIFSMNGPVFKM